MNREQIIKALECCSKQYKDNTSDKCPDCMYHNSGCNCVLQAITDALALIKELTQANEQLSESYDHLEKTKDELLSERSRLTEENERLRAENKRYAELEEGCYVTGYKNIKADTVQEIKTQFALHYGTHTDKDMTPIMEMFKLLDQIEKDIKEGK